MAKIIKKKPKKKEKKNQMFVELDRVMDQISRDKGIPKERMVAAVEEAFLGAARKKFGYLGELETHYDAETGEIELFQFKTMVENVEDPNTQLTIEQGHELDPDAEIGDSLGVKMDPNIFGRIAAQAAKQVIISKVREAERDIIYSEYKDRVGELVTGIVRRHEKGEIIIDLGRSEAVIPRVEQVRDEQYKVGERVQAYFLEINPHARGSMIILSRRHPNLVKKLFEMEAPEVADGTVEIRAVAREAGVRTKIGVYSKDSDVDPVGACVGMKGSRVQSIVQELRNEKIDIVPWDEDPARFVCNAIQPADVVKVIIKERDRSMEVVVPDDQLSLAIGKRGQNVRLASQLTGWNIDVLGETKVEDLNRRLKVILARILEVDESEAIILHAHGFRQFEDIARVDWENFKTVPGFSEETLKDLKGRAEKALVEKNSTDVLVKSLAVEDEKLKVFRSETQEETGTHSTEIQESPEKEEESAENNEVSEKK